MSIKKISKDQPENFKFNDKNLEAAEKVISNYPKGKQQSAVMALLYIAQRQNNNWIPLSAMKYIARYLIWLLWESIFSKYAQQHHVC
jgi:NADH:ubiquinone oxidoreductase subunit E